MASQTSSGLVASSMPTPTPTPTPSSAAAAVPPGVDIHEDQSQELVAIFIVFTILSGIAVALRLYARRIAKLPLWWDDWCLVASQVVVIAHCAVIMQSIKYGLGKHQAVLPKQNLPLFGMWMVPVQCYYPIVVTGVKCSLLFLYIRLFGIRTRLKQFCYVMIGLVVAWGISTLLTTIFQCTPVAATWDHRITNATCINLREWLLGTNIPNILMDLIIILIPIPFVWELKLSVARKIGLCVIFLLAFVTTITSILRVVVTAQINIKDATFSYGGISIYSTVEGSVGIICASIPILAPLFRVCMGKRAVTGAAPTADKSYGSNNSSRGGHTRNKSGGNQHRWSGSISQSQSQRHKHGGPSHVNQLSTNSSTTPFREKCCTCGKIIVRPDEEAAWAATSPDSSVPPNAQYWDSTNDGMQKINVRRDFTVESASANREKW